MKRRWPYLILPTVTLFLEILPYGAVCSFANPEGDPWRKTFSYFSLTPFGYANFGPFLTAIITCIILTLLLTHLVFKRDKAIVATKGVLCAGVVLSLCPLFLGIDYFSVVGALISASLLAELVLLFATSERECVS